MDSFEGGRSILLKPAKLTAEEWQVMAMHDRFGVEIINSSFQCAALTELVRTHHAFYGGDPSKPHLPQGDQIPLGARIISIADAFDAMVSNRPYRPGCAPSAAIAELRRCAGRQFDPRLVEDFAALMEHRLVPGAAGEHQVTREAALNIGLQIERIVSALDAQDLPGLKMLVARLHVTAGRSCVPKIAAAAQSFAELSCDDDADLVAIVQATSELVELCRSTHTNVLQELARTPE